LQHQPIAEHFERLQLFLWIIRFVDLQQILARLRILRLSASALAHLRRRLTLSAPSSPANASARSNVTGQSMISQNCDRMVAATALS
ncbi:hypothetical protein, partial [Enterobacter hormaechei]|uniref:hypothetical protein n=1 Tax=Enterobacter hormaechei TaxID=158836 RepID=UPI0033147698